jgi:competence protein ComEA
MQNRPRKKVDSYLGIWLVVSAFLCFVCFALGYQKGSATHADFSIYPEHPPVAVEADQTGETERVNRANSSVYPININFADAETLQLLPGIGETRAQAIIAYREEHGLFTAKEELTQVSGIGQETLKEIQDLIEIRDSE